MKRAALVALLVLGLSTPALAQQADLDRAREAFKEANDLHDKGDLKGALTKYELANQLGHTVVTAFELGKAYVEQSMLLEAEKVLADVDKIPIKVNESEKTKQSREAAAKLLVQLDQRIPKLVITLENAPAGSTVELKVDDQPATPLQPRKLNPGRHTIVATATGGPPVTATVELVDHETRALTLTLPEVTPVTPVHDNPVHDNPVHDNPVHDNPPQKEPDRPIVTPPPPPTTTGSWSTARSLGVVVASVGAASLITSLITGMLTLSKATTIQNHCNAFKQCDNEGLSAAQSGGTLATITNITLIGGGVLLVGGIVLAVVSGNTKTEKPRASWWVISPDVHGVNASLGGSF
jgi:hypothetical protein